MRWIVGFALFTGCGARSEILAPPPLALTDASVSDAAAEVAVDVAGDVPVFDAEVDAAVGDVIHPFEGPCSKTGWCWTHPLPFGDGARDIYRAPSGTIWGLGSESLHRFSGGVWTTYWFDDTPQAMAGVGEQLFLVGTSIVVFDGADFRKHVDPVEGTRLLGVAARAANDVVAVGEKGAVVRFDGHDWTELAEDASERWTSVAIVSREELWIGGGTRRMHLALDTWTKETTSAPIVSLATDGPHVWSSTATETDLLMGSAWTKIADEGGRLHARALDDLFIGGATLDRIHAGKHEVLRAAPAGFLFHAIDARSLEDVWVGSEGAIGYGTDLAHGPFDGLLPVTKTAGTTTWNDVFGRSPDELFAIAFDSMMAFDGKSWRSAAVPKGRWSHGTISPDGQMFLGESNKGFVVGRVLRRDGDAFVDLGYPGEVVFDLWSPDAKTVYVAGGTANYRWDGAWTKLPGYGAYAVSGTEVHDVWFVWQELITHFDGTTAVTTRLRDNSFGAVIARATDDIWVTPLPAKAPSGANVAHFDGKGWTAFPLSLPVFDMDSDGTNLWVMNDGAVAHGNGTSWSKESLGGSYAIYAHTAKQQHVVGYGGIARRRIEP